MADTSFLVALLHDTDEHHAKAVTQANGEETIFVPPAALVETMALVRHRARPAGGKTRNAVALQAMENLGAKPNVVLGEPAHDHDHAWRLWRANPGLTYADSAVIAAARGKGLPLRTFDTDQLAVHQSEKA